MIELLKKMMGNSSLSDTEIESLASEFSRIAILELVAGASSRLTPSDSEDIKKLIEEKRGLEVFEKIKQKYTLDEFNEIVKNEIVPLFEDYMKKVALGK